MYIYDYSNRESHVSLDSMKALRRLGKDGDLKPASFLHRPS